MQSGTASTHAWKAVQSDILRQFCKPAEIVATFEQVVVLFVFMHSLIQTDFVTPNAAAPSGSHEISLSQA